MAKVITVEVPRGEFFGGSGVAVFHPYRTKRSEPAPAPGATPEELLAAAAEALSAPVGQRHWSSYSPSLHPTATSSVMGDLFQLAAPGISSKRLNRRL